jgi:DnaJ-class molecular chaperone
VARATENHYETLGVSRRCTAGEIRNAYRLLVKQHHPDLHSQSAEAIERSQELNAAYETLSDPARRRAYDLELDDAGASARRVRGTRIERNVSEDVNLRMEEFLRGTSLTVRVNDPGNSGEPETYELDVPPMTAPGARFRIPRAAPFAGGFVQVRLRALPGYRFKARGSDLRCDLRIDTRLATNGGSESVPGVDGRALRITIPPRIARGEVLRVPGEGLPKPRGGRGDLLVRVTYRPEVRVTRGR